MPWPPYEEPEQPATARDVLITVSLIVAVLAVLAAVGLLV